MVRFRNANFLLFCSLTTFTTIGNVGDSDMHDMVSAVAGAGASPIVRIRGPTLPVIKRALDTGAQYVIGNRWPICDWNSNLRTVGCSYQ